MGRASRRKRARKNSNKAAVARSSFWNSKGMIYGVLAFFALLAVGTVVAAKF